MQREDLLVTGKSFLQSFVTSSSSPQSLLDLMVTLSVEPLPHSEVPGCLLASSRCTGAQAAELWDIVMRAVCPPILPLDRDTHPVPGPGPGPGLGLLLCLGGLNLMFPECETNYVQGSLTPTVPANSCSQTSPENRALCRAVPLLGYWSPGSTFLVGWEATVFSCFLVWPEPGAGSCSLGLRPLTKSS